MALLCGRDTKLRSGNAAEEAGQALMCYRRASRALTQDCTSDKIGQRMGVDTKATIASGSEIRLF
jgi:hypothetical protein